MFGKDQPHPKTWPESLAYYVREMTDGGRDIVRFLMDVMQNGINDAKPCHRLEATQQLLDYRYHKDLADYVRETTDDGRLIVRFLLDVIQHKIDDVRPRDRVQARKLINQIFNGETWIPIPVPPED